MKKWTRPVVVEEQFTANSNVSVCYSLVCTLPGKDPYTEMVHLIHLLQNLKLKIEVQSTQFGENNLSVGKKSIILTVLYLRVITKILAYLKNQVVMRLRFQISELIKQIQLQMVDILQFGQVVI